MKETSGQITNCVGVIHVEWEERNRKEREKR